MFSHKPVSLAMAVDLSSCGMCSSQIEQHNAAMNCDRCEKWFCIACLGMSTAEYQLYNTSEILQSQPYLCSICLEPGRNAILTDAAIDKKIEALKKWALVEIRG